MSVTYSFADTETAGFADEDSSVVGDRGRRHRRGRSNRRQRIPTDEALIYYSSSSAATFTSPDDHSYNYSHCDRVSVVSEEEVADVESDEAMVHGRRCRICHLNRNDDDDEVVEEEEAMELGCDCKGDLGTAHKKCAVTWFLIKGDLTCEICGAIVENLFEMAQNVPVEQIRGVNHGNVEIQTPEVVFDPEIESESSSDAQRFINILLGCMVFAFLITWLFHINMAH